MEELIIKSFPVIGSANIKIDNFNIITGEQGTGKSLICKLVFFFRTIPEKLIDSSQNCVNVNTRNSAISQDFYKIFFWETIRNENLDIEYRYESGETIRMYKGIGLSKINFEISNKLNAQLQQTKRYSQQLRKKSDGFSIDNKDKTLRDQASKSRELFFGQNETMTIYIPAGRNSYSQVDAVVYDLLNSKFDIDEMLKTFFGTYKNFMKMYQRGFPFIEKDEDKAQFVDLEKRISNIIKGKILIEKESIFLIQKEKKLPQLYLSSGQLEILPIAIVLSTLFALIKGIKNNRIRIGSGNYSNLKVLCIIEEPEAHLFPESQKEIIDIFGLLSSIFPENMSFFLTTHSPYILTSVNIQLLRGKVLHEDDQSNELSKKGWLSPHITALHIEHSGKVTNIYDEELNLVNPHFISIVSEKVDGDFIELLNKINK